MKKAAKKTKPTKLPYSFDMTQPNKNGLVSIDACVPKWVADRMLVLLATLD